MTLMTGIWCPVADEFGPSLCSIPLDADKPGLLEKEGGGFILPAAHFEPLGIDGLG